MNPARLLEYEGDPVPEPAVDELQQLPGQVAKLTSDVDHIRTGVADIKVQLLAIDNRMRAMDERLCGKIEAGDLRLDGKMDQGLAKLEGKIDQGLAKLDGKIDQGLAKLDGKIDQGLTKLDGKMDEGFGRLDGKIDQGLAKLDGKIDQGFGRLDGRIDVLQREIFSAKIWAFGLYVAQGAALLFVMAKGFKWI